MARSYPQATGSWLGLICVSVITLLITTTTAAEVTDTAPDQHLESDAELDDGFQHLWDLVYNLYGNSQLPSDLPDEEVQGDAVEDSGMFNNQLHRRKRLARFQSECMTDYDCPSGTCCIPTVGRDRVRECRRLRTMEELCHPHSKDTPFSGVRGFPLCPCQGRLVCNKLTWKCGLQM